MKRLTKMIAVFLAAVSVLSMLAGCGGKQGESESGEKPVLEYFMPRAGRRFSISLLYEPFG